MRELQQLKLLSIIIDMENLIGACEKQIEKRQLKNILKKLDQLYKEMQ